MTVVVSSACVFIVLFAFSTFLQNIRSLGLGYLGYLKVLYWFYKGFLVFLICVGFAFMSLLIVILETEKD